MKNKILERRAALEAALITINFKIKTLKPHYSREQVRCWYVLRKQLCSQLKNLPTVQQVQAGAKRLNYSNTPLL